MHTTTVLTPAHRLRNIRLHRLRSHSLDLALALLLLALTGYAAHADIKISFDLKNGDKISDKTKIVAHINSSADIEKADFYVDGDLRSTANSVPYFYDWDTIADTEGMHTVKVTATDVNGKTKSASLSVVIDNGLDQGADALAMRAREALTANDLDTALRYARRSLKAAPDNLSAARVLASIAARSGDYDRATAVLAKANGLDASSDALLELASYRMHLALMPEHADTSITEFQAVSALRRKAADLAVEVARNHNPGDTPASHETIGDALLNAGRTQDAIAEYSKSAIGEHAPLTSLNRLALAYILNNQSEDALNLLRPTQIAKQDDANLRALVGLALLRQQKWPQARAIVEQDLNAPTPATLVIASYSDMLLRKFREAQNEANEAVRLVPASGDAYYALSMAALNPLDSSEAATKTLALSPFQTGPYLDYAARVALQKRNDRYNQALNMVDFVLKMDPQNVNAQIIRALVDLQIDHADEAKTILEALYKLEPKSPDVLMAMCAYCNVKNVGAKTGDYMDLARDIDPLHFTLQLPPSPLECLDLLERRVHYRPDFFLTAGTLYPPPSSATAATQ